MERFSINNIKNPYSNFIKSLIFSFLFMIILIVTFISVFPNNDTKVDAIFHGVSLTSDGGGSLWNPNTRDSWVWFSMAPDTGYENDYVRVDYGIIQFLEIYALKVAPPLLVTTT